MLTLQLDQVRPILDSFLKRHPDMGLLVEVSASRDGKQTDGSLATAVSNLVAAYLKFPGRLTVVEGMSRSDSCSPEGCNIVYFETYSR